MEFDLRRVAENVRKAATDDLLDRVTVYRDGMEPAAVDLMENELARRGWTPDDIAGHETYWRERALFQSDGIAYRCSLCDRPAVVRRWSWHRLWGRLPVFPRPVRYCDEHGEATAEPGDDVSTERP